MARRNSANIGRIVICILTIPTIGFMITPVGASEWTNSNAVDTLDIRATKTRPD